MIIEILNPCGIQTREECSRLRSLSVPWKGSASPSPSSCSSALPSSPPSSSFFRSRQRWKKWEIREIYLCYFSSWCQFVGHFGSFLGHFGSFLGHVLVFLFLAKNVSLLFYYFFHLWVTDKRAMENVLFHLSLKFYKAICT